MPREVKCGAHRSVCSISDISVDDDMVRLKELVGALSEDRKEKLDEYLDEDSEQQRSDGDA